MRVLRCGTRGSALARAQAEGVRTALERRHPGLRVELVVVRTTGDRLREGPLPGGKGVFVKELEEGLLAGDLDLAVHSLKDVPALLSPGLVVGAVPRREDARDVLVADNRGGIRGLPRGARVGTASVRRRAQLARLRPDVECVFLRGNVDTRLRKWRTGTVDALLLAAAGLARLGIVDSSVEPVPAEEILPAVGQGALALECRADDSTVRDLLRAVADADAEATTSAERSFLRAMGGDCRTALAAYATVEGPTLRLRAEVLAPDGSEAVSAVDTAPRAEATALGERLARALRARGAENLLGR